VPAAEFEAALFDSSNAKTLNALYQYQKIERIKNMDDYKAYVKSRKDGTFHEPTPPAEATVTTRKRAKKLTPVLPPDEPSDESPEQENQSEEA
jgi:hypothetical protein